MERLDRKLREYCDREQIGGRMRITVKDKILYEANFGLADRERGIPFTEDSVFSLYSITKPFCAIAFLLLADRGLVSPDDHPAFVIPEVKDLPSDLRFRHLLCHVSGLPDPVQDALFPQEGAAQSSAEIRALLPRLASFPSLFAPDHGARYANINFVLCAIAIENISGVSFEEFMKKEIFTPLGMTGAWVDRPSLSVPHRVQGYELSPEGCLIPVEKTMTWSLGAGDLLGRVEDVYALNRAVKHRLLLKEETWQAALTPSPHNGMGMGCTLKPFYGKKQVRHNGGSRGFRTLHVHLPEDDFDLIFLSNSGFGNARRDLAAMVNEHFYGACRGDDEIAMDTGYIDR